MAHGLQEAGVSQPEIDTITAINADARLEALQVAFALVGFVSLLGVFVNKVAPLD